MSEIVIVGPGAIGGTFAALLAQTGRCRVTLVGRAGAHIDAIRRDGLRLEGLREITVELAATSDATEISACDALIYAVKAQDTERALAATAHIEPRALVASVQNGVIKDELLAEAFGAERVIGALTAVAGERPEPGVVRWTYDGGTHLGEPDGHASARVDELVDLLAAAGLTTEASSGIASASWTKLVAWAAIGLLASLSGQSNAGVLSSERLAGEFVATVRELASLADARRVELIDLGPFHIRSWLDQSDADATRSVMSSPLASSGSTHSALQDIRRGRPTEMGAVIGPLLADAARRSVSLPRVSVLYAALLGLEESLG